MEEQTRVVQVSIAGEIIEPEPVQVRQFTDMPIGMKAFENWEPFKIDGPANALIIADAHIPYQVTDAFLSAVHYGESNGADLVILNGDFCDFFAISWWERDPRKKNFKHEISVARLALSVVRERFPKARIIYKLGNHEERYESYMMAKAPELLGVDDFSLKKILELDKHGIELVEDKRPIQLGKLNVIHGHEYRFAISNPVNPARGLFLRAKKYAICGHFHQPSYHPEKTIEGDVISCWSTGCLCDLHPEYRPINNWLNGFAFVRVESNGKFEVDNKVIKDGHVYQA